MSTKSSGPTSGMTPDVSAAGTRRPNRRSPKHIAFLRFKPDPNGRHIASRAQRSDNVQIFKCEHREDLSHVIRAHPHVENLWTSFKSPVHSVERRHQTHARQRFRGSAPRNAGGPLHGENLDDLLHLAVEPCPGKPRRLPRRLATSWAKTLTISSTSKPVEVPERRKTLKTSTSTTTMTPTATAPPPPACLPSPVENSGGYFQPIELHRRCCTSQCFCGGWDPWVRELPLPQEADPRRSSPPGNPEVTHHRT